MTWYDLVVSGALNGLGNGIGVYIAVHWVAEHTLKPLEKKRKLSTRVPK